MKISRMKGNTERVVITQVPPGDTFIFKGMYYLKSIDKTRATNLSTGAYHQFDTKTVVTLRKMKVVLL